MTATQIHGAQQIQLATITNAQLAAAAGITDGQLAGSYVFANGTRAFTAEVGGVTPTLTTSLATKGYVDAVAQGLANKYSARAATVGTENFTIASGSVTTITGTTLDGLSPAVNDYVLIKDAPAASGTGSPNSTQPANGLYQVTANTTNLSVTRAADMNGSNGPYGSYVFVVAGTTNGGSGWVVGTPSTTAAFTYGSGNISFTQFSGAGEITTDSTITKNGNQLVRAAITGDVGVPSGSNTSTIQAGAVSLSKMANLAANSVIGNLGGSPATPVAIAIAIAASASSVALRDGSANLTVNSLIEGMTTTATAAGTTTLTVSSTGFQQFTGSTTQTVVLPNATTMSNGQSFMVANRSSGVVTINANGGGLVQTMAPGSQTMVTLVNNGTAAGTWDSAYSVTNAAGGTVTSVSVATANGLAGTVATATTTPAITLTTSVTGLVKGNGTALSAASAGTDYLAPSGYSNRETPSGTVNGSNTTFTLANTPTTGSEMVFLNGVLQEPGGQDYTITTNSIAFVSAPSSGARIRVTYWH